MTTRNGIHLLIVALMLVGCNDAGMTAEANAAAPVATQVGYVDVSPAPAPADPPKIQVALLLDNSGSMGGLINQARTQLWAFINEFATTSKNGQRPSIEVALYIYGNPPATLITPLTRDLDLVSEKLFDVRINGSSEYCGEVIQAAVEGLEWSDDSNDLKVIFIAGNERFTQGSVSYVDACRAAISQGIIVNTIHCGDEAAGIRGKWDQGALLADGTYLCINQNTVAPQIAAPQDDQILVLDQELNKTYVAFGAEGLTGEARQRVQDSNAAGMSPSVAVDRALAKSTSQYTNATWDLVDAVNTGAVELEEVPADSLPEAMRDMSAPEQQAYIAEQTQRRTEIQTEIQELSRARADYVAEKTAELAGQDETLQSAVITIVREQAEAKDFVQSE